MSHWELKITLLPDKAHKVQHSDMYLWNSILLGMSQIVMQSFQTANYFLSQTFIIKTKCNQRHGIPLSIK